MKHLNRSFSKVAASLVFLGVALPALPAVAQTNGGGGGDAFVAQLAGAAQSPLARLTALIATGGNVIRSKGVASVTNPSTGITCIKPKPGAGINIGKIVPAVSVEWGFSIGNDLAAYYFSNEPFFFTDCPPENIEVRTYDFAGNLSGRVAFTIVVD